MNSAPPTPAPLDYAAEPRRRHRRTIIWGLGLLGLLIGLFVVRQPAQALLRRVQLLNAINACATYQLTAAELVYDEGPYDSSIKLPELYSKPVLVPQPSAWLQVRSSTIGPNRYPEATLFLHRLRTPNGLERIVHIGRSWQGYEMQPLVLRYVMVHPAGLRGAINTDAGSATVLQETEKREYLDARSVYPFIIQPGLSNIRFYAGRPDGVDPARFVIPFEIDGEKLQIIGQLTEYGTLLFTIPGPEEEPEGE